MTKEVAKTKLKEILLEGYTLKSMIKETQIEEFIDELYSNFEKQKDHD